jgi:hypothetical protein
MFRGSNPEHATQRHGQVNSSSASYWQIRVSNLTW